MASSAVNIISNAYGNSRINNAASDSTLREIIDAIEGIESGSSGGSAAARSKTNKNIKAGKDNLDSTRKAFGSLFKSLGTVAGAGWNFVEMVADGKTSASDYGEAINNSLIKNLPFVGEQLGSIGDVITTGIKILESWNSELKNASQSGASFNNSIIALKKSAVRAQLDLPFYVQLIVENSEKLRGFGGTVTQGAEAFADFNEGIKNGNPSVELVNMGFTTESVSEAAMFYMTSVLRTGNRQILTNSSTQESFLHYTKNYDRLIKLTGKGQEEIEKAAAVAAQDAAYQLKMNQLGTDEKTKMKMALDEIAARYGPAGAELFKASFLGSSPQSDAAIALSTIFPHLTKNIDALQGAAYDSKVSVKNMAVTNRRIMIDSMLSAASRYNSITAFVDAASSGADGMDGLYDAMKPILTEISKYGDTTKLTREMLEKAFDKAETEAGARDGFTEFMREFELAIQRFSAAFSTSIIPALEMLSDAFKKHKFGDRIREFGSLMGQWAGDALKKTLTFFGLFSSDEGREIVKTLMNTLMNQLGIKIRYAFKRFFTLGLAGDRKDQAAEEMRERMRRDEALKKGGLLDKNNMKGQPIKINWHGKDWWIIPEKVDGKYVGYDNPNMTGTQGTAQDFDLISEIDERIRAQNLGVNFSNMGDKDKEILKELYESPIEVPVAGKTYFVKPSRITEGNYLGYLNKNLSGDAYNMIDERKLIESIIQYRERTRQELGFRAGTLGTFGSMFANFGKSTPVQLHGKEAVVTPKQLGDVVKTRNQLLMTDFINSLNTNMSVLIDLTKQELRIERSKLEANQNIMI